MPGVYAGEEDGRVRLAPLDRPISIEHLLTHTSGIYGEAPHPALAAAYDNLGDSRYALPGADAPARRAAPRAPARRRAGGTAGRHNIRAGASDRGRRRHASRRIPGAGRSSTHSRWSIRASMSRPTRRDGSQPCTNPGLAGHAGSTSDETQGITGHIPYSIWQQGSRDHHIRLPAFPPNAAWAWPG